MSHESTPKNAPNERNLDTHLQALEPGYFSWDGLPTKRDAYAENPQFFNGAEWLEVDPFKFAHEARRVTKEEFKGLLALQKKQHAEFIASKNARRS